jgi:hypothetical protein
MNIQTRNEGNTYLPNVFFAILHTYLFNVYVQLLQIQTHCYKANHTTDIPSTALNQI